MADIHRRRVVLAPDKFKGTLTAREVAEAMLRGVPADIEADVVPVADGGDGSVYAAITAGWQPGTLPTVDAWGDRQETPVAVSGRAAIAEVASICGLGARKPTAQDAARASSYGVGMVLHGLVTRGFNEITLGLGGSATTDAGTGMLRALGVRLLDAHGRDVFGDSRALTSVTGVDGLEQATRLLDGVQLTLACDVDTPMVGSDGSAEMFAAQKGADEPTIHQLSEALRHVADVLEPAFGVRGVCREPGSGAAGGLGWAGMLLGGKVTSGAHTFLELLGAADKIAHADVVVTGEGRLDRQTLRGKAPYVVAEHARNHGVPCVAVVGHSSLPGSAPGPFDEVVAIDRADPKCIDDLDLARKLIADATGSLLSRHLSSSR